MSASSRASCRSSRAGQVLEHGVRLIRRPGITAFDDALEGCELVVQPDRVVQRILVAAVAVLVDLAFDGRELLTDRVAETS